MAYHDIYEMSTDDIINMWNKFCLEHDRERLVVYTMSDWRREVADTHIGQRGLLIDLTQIDLTLTMSLSLMTHVMMYGYHLMISLPL